MNGPVSVREAEGGGEGCVDQNLKNISHRLCLKNLKSQLHESGGLSTHSSQSHYRRDVWFLCVWVLTSQTPLRSSISAPACCLPWLFEALGSPLLVKWPTVHLSVYQTISIRALLCPTSPYARLYLRLLINNPAALRLEARSRQFYLPCRTEGGSVSSPSSAQTCRNLQQHDKYCVKWLIGA